MPARKSAAPINLDAVKREVVSEEVVRLWCLAETGVLIGNQHAVADRGDGRGTVLVPAVRTIPQGRLLHRRRASCDRARAARAVSPLTPHTE